MKRASQYLITEPFRWILYAFFQPRRLEQELGVVRFRQRFLLMLRVALPTFLFAYPVSVLGYFIGIFLHIIPATDTLSILLVVFIYVTAGVVFGGGIVFGVGVVFGAVFGGGGGGIMAFGGGVIFGTLISIAGALVGGGVFGLAGVVFGLAVVVFGGLAAGVVFGLAVVTVFGRLVAGVVGGLVLLMIFIVSLTFSILLGVSENNISVDISTSLAFSLCYFIGLFRLPFYLVSGPSTLRAYLSSRKNPTQVFTFLQRSSLHWDEIVYLPLPYLKNLLLLAYDQDTERVLEEIVFIATERPRQIWAAQAAFLEIAVRDLERRTTMVEIAGVFTFLDDLFPQEAKLLDPQWATPIKRLRAASRDALRFSSPVGHQARREALQDLLKQLKSVHLSTSIGNARLRARLVAIVSSWEALAEQELEALSLLPHDLGHIDNPYNPGNALKPNDPLFLGRLDLVSLLETELMKGERHSTFLMTGERRMGKSSTLLQLPGLLGSRFLPIFYDLQSSGILASTSIFLGTIADGITKRLQEHAIPVRRLEYKSLRGISHLPSPTPEITSSYSSSEESPSSAFYLFNRWLEQVEVQLERENRTVLLLFDEFEKLEAREQRRNFDLPLLLDWFRNIIQYHPRIALLFSGVRTFGEMGQQNNLNWSGYFVNVQTLRVSFLHEDEARRLISTPIPDFADSDIYGEGVIDRIIAETGCHPFLVQAVCSALIDWLNSQKKARAELPDVVRAIDITFDNWWDTYFRDLWIRTDDPQRLCLSALVKLTAADMSQIQQECHLETRTVQRTLRALLKRDLIQEDSEQTYHISTPIFSRWVERCIDE